MLLLLLFIQIACGDYHCAAVTESGRIFTFGSKENGKLGHGRDAASGYVNEVTKFLDVDEQTLILDVKIGYVSSKQKITSNDIEIMHIRKLQNHKLV